MRNMQQFLSDVLIQITPATADKNIRNTQKLSFRKIPNFKLCIANNT